MEAIAWILRFHFEIRAGEPPKDGEKPPRPKKMRRRERFGTYDKTFEDELDMVPLEKVSLIYTILVVSSISGWATPPLTQYSQVCFFSHPLSSLLCQIYAWM